MAPEPTFSPLPGASLTGRCHGHWKKWLTELFATPRPIQELCDRSHSVHTHGVYRTPKGHCLGRGRRCLGACCHSWIKWAGCRASPESKVTLCLLSIPAQLANYYEKELPIIDQFCIPPQRCLNEAQSLPLKTGVKPLKWKWWLTLLSPSGAQ